MYMVDEKRIYLDERGIDSKIEYYKQVSITDFAPYQILPSRVKDNLNHNSFPTYKFDSECKGFAGVAFPRSKEILVNTSARSDIDFIIYHECLHLSTDISKAWMVFDSFEFFEEYMKHLEMELIYNSQLNEEIIICILSCWAYTLRDIQLNLKSRYNWDVNLSCLKEICDGIYTGGV